MKWEFGEIMHVKQVSHSKLYLTFFRFQNQKQVSLHMSTFLSILMECSLKFQGTKDVLTFLTCSYQLFQCVEAPNPETDPGGETTFCHSVSLIKEAPKEKVDLWKKAK